MVYSNTNAILEKKHQGVKQKFDIFQKISIYVCFLKWWYPQNTPKWSFLVGKPVVGYQHLVEAPIWWNPSNLKLSLLFFQHFSVTTWPRDLSKVPKVRHLHHDNRTSTRNDNPRFEATKTPPTTSLQNYSWWLNQPIWKICSSNWIMKPQVSGWTWKNIWNHQSTESFWQWDANWCGEQQPFWCLLCLPFWTTKISNFQVLPVFHPNKRVFILVPDLKSGGEVYVTIWEINFGHLEEAGCQPVQCQLPAPRKTNMTVENPPFERCISYWTWEFSKVMLVFRGVMGYLLFWAKSLVTHWITGSSNQPVGSQLQSLKLLIWCLEKVPPKNVFSPIPQWWWTKNGDIYHGTK